MRNISGKQSSSNWLQKTKQNQSLTMNLMKEVKDIYNENYRTLKKTVDWDKGNGKTSHVHELWKLILFKWLCY